MEQVTRLLRASCFAGFSLTLACSGTIQDPGNANQNASGSVGAGNNTGNGGAGTGAGTATGAGPGTVSGGATSTGSTGNTPGAGGSATAGGGPSNGGTATGTGGSPTVLTPPANPGFVVARRLNHAEYNNTVRDLLGTTQSPANDFPADDLGGDFDTVGSALSLSPAYVAAYEKAAQALTTYAFSSGKVRLVRAHTRPEANASTRVLAKCGFRRVGEVINPEDGLVWRWEKGH